MGERMGESEQPAGTGRRLTPGETDLPGHAFPALSGRQAEGSVCCSHGGVEPRTQPRLQRAQAGLQLLGLADQIHALAVRRLTGNEGAEVGVQLAERGGGRGGHES